MLINGRQFRDAIISASNNLWNNKKKTDDLNIFPVPDGDTGTNMSMTISAAAKEMKNLSDDVTISEVAKIAASAMLRGARGNSGVILSLLFRGFFIGLEGRDEADGSDLGSSLSVGVKEAYSAVMKPTEGTMLTVSRVAGELAVSASIIDNDPVYVWGALCTGAEESLKETPELLPVLKKAGVVDAGGYGLTLIFDGMLSVFKHGKIVELSEGFSEEELGDNFFESAAAKFDGEITFTYCTEFIANKNSDKRGDIPALREYLETIGDCVVVVDDESIIKVHVHTEDPGLALQKALEFGDLIHVKVENMREQHKAAISASPKTLKKLEPSEDYGFVSVAAGQGLSELFTELGCNHVVSGGQTMNPSTEDIVAAVNATPAKTVFVLPNNKNIILAAKQAVPLVTDRKIVIIPTKTIPQGLTAMLTFEGDSDAQANAETMTSAMESVHTGLVTFAARDSEFGGHKIKQGEILGLVDGKMEFIEKKASTACSKVIKELVTKHTLFITIIYGEDCSEEEATSLFEHLQSKYGSHIEMNLVNGGQPVYQYIVSVE